MDAPISFIVSLTESTISILSGTEVVLLPYTQFYKYKHGSSLNCLLQV